VDGEIIWADRGSLGLTGLDLIVHYWLVGRADGRCCGNGCFTTSAEFARRYARADKNYGDRPGRAYWLGFARSRRGNDLGQMTTATASG
jgi:hypothetical protein